MKIAKNSPVSQPLIETILVKAEMEAEEELTIIAGELAQKTRISRRDEVIFFFKKIYFNLYFFETNFLIILTGALQSTEASTVRGKHNELKIITPEISKE